MPILLILTVGFVIFLNVSLRNNKKTFNEVYKEEVKNFEQNETIPKNIFAEKKLDLENLSFIKSNSPSINFLKNNLKEFQNKKIIISDDNISNFEIKQQYGKNILSQYTIYENNYREYLYALNTLAKTLIDYDDFDSAIKILDEAINLKSSMSNTYTLYFEAQQKINPSYKFEDMLKNSTLKNNIWDNKFILEKFK